MREIKFRGQKATRSKKWKYGYYRSNNMGNHFITTVLYKSRYYAFDEVEVYGDTLCQYTGLKDKNGVEIYEGDKIQGNCDHEHGLCLIANAIIEYDEEQCAYVAREYHGVENELTDEHYIYDICDLNDIEVIGNIHEN